MRAAIPGQDETAVPPNPFAKRKPSGEGASENDEASATEATAPPKARTRGDELLEAIGGFQPSGGGSAARPAAEDRPAGQEDLLSEPGHESEPTTPSRGDESVDLGATGRASKGGLGKAPGASSGDSVGLRTYTVPDLEAPRDPGVDRQPTGAFFRLKQRFKSDGWAITKAIRARRSRRRRIAPEGGGEDRLARVRPYVMAGLAVVTTATVALLTWIERPRELSLETDRGRFVAVLPVGFDQIDPVEGTLETGVGALEFSARAVRNRHDPVGFLLFGRLDMPDVPAARREAVVLAVLEKALYVQGAEILEPEAVEQGVWSGLEADYTASRFNHSFEGRGRVLATDDGLVLLVCEGEGEACATDARVEAFFHSLHHESE